MSDNANKADFVQRTMKAVYAYEESRPAARLRRHPAVADILLKAGAAGGIGLGLISTARLFAAALAPGLCG
ncbi:hypothetical protein Dalk_4341 [Desulfatibacillum aliphaticivorans]|uniref:Uncharacterized protein n=1 Tax=Desulfatibacillum aliphaticivorans TaxID=218208 RepID=B8FN51_DESAL|nr:hypothetical protein [Desulfatibacillum aliphaticivorans]ACL06020.1 hypothetical protein Dalk_4341 [Desulfatibacillum aliphaticivorans]